MLHLQSNSLQIRLGKQWNMVQVLGHLYPCGRLGWLLSPGFGLVHPWLKGHLESEPVNGRPLSFSFSSCSITLPFYIYIYMYVCIYIYMYVYVYIPGKCRYDKKFTKLHMCTHTHSVHEKNISIGF